MFGCLAVCIAEKIFLILRDKDPGQTSAATAHNGVRCATTGQHHDSLRQEFPNMRPMKRPGRNLTGWQLLPVDGPDIDEASLRACALIAAGDPGIGKVPEDRRKPKP
jgi:hypothetical protein